VRTISPLVAASALVAACTPVHEYSFQAAGGGPERGLPPTHVRVATNEDNEARAVPAKLVAIPFGPDRDSVALVSQFLARADEAKAVVVTDLAIYSRTTRDGVALECRTEIIPETVTDSEWVPEHSELRGRYEPVTRTVTENQTSCGTTMKTESHMVTEYERQCHYVTRPVQRTRTVYRTHYDSFSKSSVSSPETESYTDYSSEYECNEEPVTRYKTEEVPHYGCTSEPVTRTVTRDEYKLENEFVPGRNELTSRQHLRELDPVCYPAPTDSVMAPGSRPSGNRIQGKLHIRPHAPVETRA
jgi:hypothetical protein